MRIIVAIMVLGLMVTSGIAQDKPEAEKEKKKKTGGQIMMETFQDFHKKKEFALNAAAPAMHAKDSDGVEMDLKEYLGQWVFIEFGSYT
ncbi:MAG: hypothetical protein L3J82_01035 [Planctomycetes bacterium]|nr:hypothetical protein [Planctomycetota bacterium]